jgi:hypothetical protein
VGGVDDQQVDAGVDQPLGALEAVTDGGRSGDAQAALRVLRGVRVELRLLDVLDRDQPDADGSASTTSSFSMRCLWRRRLASSWLDVLGDRDQVLHASSARRPAGSGWRRSARRGWSGCRPGGRRNGSAHAAILDDRDAGNAVGRISALGIGERRVRPDDERVHHHARFELLDLADLLGLLGGREVAMDDADAAGLAMAMASRASVTVSIAADRIGMLRSMSRVMRVPTLVSPGHALRSGRAAGARRRRSAPSRRSRFR